MGDEWGRTFPDRWPQVQPYIYPGTRTSPADIPHPFEMIQDDIRHCLVCGNTRDNWIHAAFEPAPEPAITREEFEDLRREMEALRDLLKAAKVYDEVTGEPDCEVDEKVELVKRVAKM